MDLHSPAKSLHELLTLLTGEQDTEYKEALAEFLTGREQVKLADEEVIDISILSKELEVQPGEDLSFSLKPARRSGTTSDDEEVKLSTLTIDENILSTMIGTLSL